LPSLPAYQVDTPQEVRGYVANLSAEKRQFVFRRLEDADLVVYSLAHGEPAFRRLVQLGRAQTPRAARRSGCGDRPAYHFGAFTRELHRRQGLTDWPAQQGLSHLFSPTFVGGRLPGDP